MTQIAQGPSRTLGGSTSSDIRHDLARGCCVMEAQLSIVTPCTTSIAREFKAALHFVLIVMKFVCCCSSELVTAGFGWWFVILASKVASYRVVVYFKSVKVLF